MRLRNYIFALLFVFFICNPIGILLTEKVGIHLPDDLTAASGQYLSGTNTRYSIKKNLNLEGILNKHLQEAIESNIDQFAPCKKIGLLTYAALQRRAIGCSSSLIGESDCYSTFYGSEIAYDRNGDSLSQLPIKKNAWLQGGISRFATGLSDLAKQFPEKRFVVIVVDNSNTSQANPAYPLCESIFTTQDANALFDEACVENDNIDVIDATYDTPESYYEDFYTTDHHWNGWGAISAYEKSLAAFDGYDAERLRSALNDIPSLEGLDWLEEHGSACRTGLMMVNEPVDEPLLDLSNIQLKKGEAPPVFLTNGVEILKDKGPIASYDFYQTWYGNWEDTITVNNDSAVPGSSALIISDSFGTAFKWVVSMGFGEVETLYDIHDSREHAEALRTTLTDNDCDTAYLVGRVTSFASVLDRFPDYLL